MTKVLFGLFLILAIPSLGQEKKLFDILPVINGKVNYTGIVIVDSTDKLKLYTKAKKWFIKQYRSAKDVIQLDDKENAEVIGKGFFETIWENSFTSERKVNVWHTVKIYLKDNKFKYEITDITLRYYVEASMFSEPSNEEVAIENFGRDRKRNTKKYFAQVDAEVMSIISSLVKFMKAPAKEDW